MTQEQPKATGKPYFSIAAAICNMISLPVAMAAIKWLNPQQEYFGYNSLAVAIITLLIFLFIGFLLAGAGALKKEQPPAFPLTIALINGVILIFAAIRLSM